MTRRKQSSRDPVEDAIRRAGSVGALEQLAGIGSTQEQRATFWSAFSALPGTQALDAGVAELKRRIRAQAPRPLCVRQADGGRHA